MFISEIAGNAFFKIFGFSYIDNSASFVFHSVDSGVVREILQEMLKVLPFLNVLIYHEIVISCYQYT